MKLCCRCKQEKVESEFNKRKDGLQKCCRECSKKQNKEHYNKNKNQYRERKKRNKEARLVIFREYKSKLKCVKCGEDHPACLDFHHKEPDEKEYNIARLAPSLNLNTLLQEIDKCIVLCSNCHRKLHWGIAQLVEH